MGLLLNDLIIFPALTEVYEFHSKFPTQSGFIAPEKNLYWFQINL